jgi:hypothetical protein
MIPSDQSTFTDEDFLEMLNEEIQYFGVPHLLRTHEEYLMTHVDVPIVAGKSEYSIPERAIGNKLRDVAYVDTAGSYYELARADVEHLSDYSSASVSDYPNSFYLKDNKVILIDGIPTTGVLRMFFYMKPNKLVEDDLAGVITDIDRTTGVITISEFPDAFETAVLYDFIGHASPNRILDYDITPVSVNGTLKILTFNIAEIPEDLQIGDYINVSGETTVAQLPEELHPILAQRVAIAALEAMSDTEAAATAQRKLDKMEESSNTLIDNRVEGAPEKILNRHSPLRAATQGFGSSRQRGRY